MVDGNSYEDDIDGEAEEEDLTLFYFESLFRRDVHERATFLKNFNKSVKKWIARTDDVASQRLLQAHLPTALRLSINSPFEDIRESMKRLLEELEVGEVVHRYSGGVVTWYPGSHNVLEERYCII